MVWMFTGGSQPNKAIIEYMLTTFLYELLLVLRRFADADLENEAKIVHLCKKILALHDYITFYYRRHIDMEEDRLRPIKFAIMDRKQAPPRPQASGCLEYMKTFQIMANIKTAIVKTRISVQHALDE